MFLSILLQLPLKIDIIKHVKEIDGKSTAIHAAILASADVSIYTYPDIPNYENERDSTVCHNAFCFYFKHHLISPQICINGQVLIFPSHDCTNVHGIFNNHVKLQCETPIWRPPGYNEGTLLMHRLNEVDDDEHTEVSNHQYFTVANLPIKRAVFIDSTWNQSRGIYKDTRINSLQSVVLQHRLSQFWRHQKNSPRWFLATIEGIRHRSQ